MAKRFGFSLGIDTKGYKKELSSAKSKTESDVKSMQGVAESLAEKLIKALSQFVNNFEEVQSQAKKTGNELKSSVSKSLDGVGESAQASSKQTRTFMQRMSGDLDAVINAFDKMGQFANSAMSTIIDASPLASSAMSLIQFQARLIAKEFGDALAPQLQQTAEKMEQLREFVEAIPTPIKTMIAQALSLVAALTTVGTVLSVVSIALSTISVPLLLIAGLVAALALAWTNNLGGIQEKTQAFVEVMMELFTTLYEGLLLTVNENSDNIKTTVSDFLNVIMTLFSSIFEALTNVVNNNMDLIVSTITNSLNSGLEAFDTILTTINTLVQNNMDSLVEIFAVSFDTFIKLAAILTKALTETFVLVSDAIKSFAEENDEQIGDVIEKFSELLQIVGPIVVKIAKLMTGILMPVFKKVLDFLKKQFGFLLDIVEGVLDVLIGLFTGDIGKIQSGFEAVVKGLLNMLIAPINFIIDEINSVFDKIKEWDLVPQKIRDAIPTIPNLPEFEKGGFIDREMVAKLHPGEVVLTAEQVKNVGGPEMALSLGTSRFNDMLSSMSASGGMGGSVGFGQPSQTINYITIANANFRSETDMERFRKIIEKNNFDDLRGDSITTSRG